MDHVSIDVFVNRIVKLSARFPNYICKFTTYYYNEKEIHKLLTEMNIEHEEYHGIYYNSYAEDCYDQCVLLNITNQETIEFNSWIWNKEQPYSTVHVESESFTRGILRILVRNNTSKSFYDSIDDPKILMKNIFSDIFPDYQPMTILIDEPLKKRTYEIIKKDNDKEKIIQEITITERRSKKIKI